MPDSRDAFAYQEKKCHECGKLFISHDPDNWAYKKNGYMFCSWHCLRDFERNHSMTRFAMKDRIIMAIEDGLTTPEIAKLLGCEVTKILYWRKKLERERKEKT